MNSRPLDAAIVGAGPYGLAAASYLHAQGIDLRVFGSLMAGWTDYMPRGMFLKSTMIDTDIGSPRHGLGLRDFCSEHGITPYDDGGGERPIPRDDFVAYGGWFQQHAVPVVEDVKVVRIDMARGGHRVELATGESFVAKNVVMAVGVSPFAYLPPQLRRARGGSSLSRVSHTRDHRDLSVFAGQRVAVLGAGQSACETAVLLHEAGANVHLVIRAPVMSWCTPPAPTTAGFWHRLRKPPAPLGAGWTHLLVARYAHLIRHLPDTTRMRLLQSILGPRAAWWLRERFSDEIDVRLARRVRGAVERDDCVELQLASVGDDDEVLEVDHVLAGTGYRFNLARMGLLSADIRTGLATVGGYPRLSKGFESSVPGIFFTGLAGAGTFGPVLRFVAGTDFAASTLSAGVTSGIRARRRSGGLPATSPAPVQVPSLATSSFSAASVPAGTVSSSSASSAPL